MPKKCPPGVICVENVTLFFIVCMVALVGYIVYRQFESVSGEKTNVVVVRDGDNGSGLHSKPSSLFSLGRSIFLNPFEPPLKENRFFPHGGPIEAGYGYARGIGAGGDVRGGVPINVNTSHYDLSYKQVGILTRQQGKETILPVFGRPLHSNRNKWQYYTMTDKNNMIRLPLSKGGRSCTNEYGCDEIFSGDSVYVEGYNDAFKATIYENDTPRYIPFL